MDELEMEEENATSDLVRSALSAEEEELLEALKNYSTSSEVLKQACLKNLGDDPDKWNTQKSVFTRLKPAIMDWWLQNKWKADTPNGKKKASEIMNVPEMEIVAAVMLEMRYPVTKMDRDKPLGKFKETLSRTYNAFLHNTILNPLKASIKVCIA